MCCRGVVLTNLGPLFRVENREQGHWHKDGTLALRRRSSVCKRESTESCCQKKSLKNQGLGLQPGMVGAEGLEPPTYAL